MAGGGGKSQGNQCSALLLVVVGGGRAGLGIFAFLAVSLERPIRKIAISLYAHQSRKGIEGKEPFLLLLP